MPVQPGRRERDNLWKLLEMAREEDLGGGDVTSAILPPEVHAQGRFIARQPMVFCGGALLETIAISYDGSLRTQHHLSEGAAAQKGDLLAEWDGPARAMMAAERVALNFLQRLSGVATTTREYVRAISGTNAAIFDTRKTTPAWRELEKYAVRVGGGKNHRRGLYDAVLIKDNHLAVLAKAEGKNPITAVGRELDRLRPHLGEHAFIELEVDTLEQFEVALTLPVDIILLDNMSLEQLRYAVSQRDEAGLKRRIELEASGGITLANVRQVAETGVERIAIGALMHSAGAVDIALDIEID
ncbi:MAG TPA: carboxylating nicotinate-nucleotide diphosphorylase [Phycisphaerae bacterium]|nr:carboxylating nicotinate-nucleotide diphosphorylase [Phycisphaerae bacterium]